MPDLQTALSKVINEWETPTELPQPAVPNVSRSTFEFVKANAGMTRVSIVKHLAAKGFKAPSISSLVTQMLRQGIFKEANKGIFVNQPEYTPIKPGVVRAAQQQFSRRKRAVDVVPAVAVAPTPAPTQPRTEITAEELLNTLPIKQARALYDELHKYFG